MKTNHLKQFTKLGKKLDFFSSPVELMIHQKRSHQSIFGAFMTILMFSCVLTYIVNKFIQLAQRKEFQTLYSEVEYKFIIETIYYEEIPVFPLQVILNNLENPMNIIKLNQNYLIF